MIIEYVQGAAYPDLAINWYSDRRETALLDFSSGWTFEIKVWDPTVGTTSFTKTTGFTGAATSPNLLVAWDATTELKALAVGRYRMEVTATKSSKSRKSVAELHVLEGAP